MAQESHGINSSIHLPTQPHSQRGIPSPHFVSGEQPPSAREHVQVPDRNTVRTLPQILELIATRHAQITAALAPIIDDVQADLEVLAGVTFPTFEENRVLATAIQKLLNCLGDLRVECLKEKCHEPAIIRCTKGKLSKVGSFVFEHSSQGRKSRHLGSKMLPHLKLTPPLPDNRFKNGE